jgi:hypothetical protein
VLNAGMNQLLKKYEIYGSFVYEKKVLTVIVDNSTNINTRES